MTKQKGPIAGVATLKAWGSRFVLFLLIGVALALMVVSRTDLALVERARTALTDIVTPILAAASQPVDTFADVAASVRELAHLRAENERLRAENERLQQWRAAAWRLKAQNEELRQLTSLAPPPDVRYVTARVIGDSGGTFVRSLLVTAGRSEGVRKGQVAVTGEGLAGRVFEVGERSARVLLITDINSRIPVLVGRTRERAILGGDNTTRPRLHYLGPRVEVAEGDLVVTSGHGGTMPSDIPVGRVAATTGEGVHVRPFVDWDSMEYLRIVDYELPGLIDVNEAVAEVKR